MSSATQLHNNGVDTAIKLGYRLGVMPQLGRNTYSKCAAGNPPAQPATGEATARWVGAVSLAARFLSVVLAITGLGAIAYTAWQQRATPTLPAPQIDAGAVYEYASNRLCSISVGECERLAHVIIRNMH